MNTLVQVTIFLLSIATLSSCSSSGWSVAGWELSPSDTSSNTVFIEIMGSDSTMHYYHGRILEQANWCWIHQCFEDLSYE